MKVAAAFILLVGCLFSISFCSATGPTLEIGDVTILEVSNAFDVVIGDVEVVAQASVFSIGEVTIAQL